MVERVGAIWRFVVDVALRWYHDGVGDLAAGVTFWILVSMPASILALLAGLGWLESLVNFSVSADVQENVLEFVDRVFTDENGGIQDAVRTLFDQNNPSLLTVSLAVAVWSISRGFAGLLRALDDIYGIEDGRAWYHTRVVAVLLGFGSLAIPVPLVVLERLVWFSIPDGPVEGTIRAIVAMVVLVLWAQMIYHFGPSHRARWLHDLPGAVVAAALWWILSIGFGWYVSLTSSANGVTAAVGAGLLALTWLWLAAQVLLIGGTVNFLWGQRYGIDRQPRLWNLNERLGDATDELRRIVGGGIDDEGEPGPKRVDIDDDRQRQAAPSADDACDSIAAAQQRHPTGAGADQRPSRKATRA